LWDSLSLIGPVERPSNREADKPRDIRAVRRPVSKHAFLGRDGLDHPYRYTPGREENPAFGIGGKSPLHEVAKKLGLQKI
jgi:hypothetical protein